MAKFIYLKSPMGTFRKYEIVSENTTLSSWLVRCNPGDKCFYLSSLYDNGYTFIKIVDNEKW